jgi:hypothetical protein
MHPVQSALIAVLPCLAYRDTGDVPKYFAVGMVGMRVYDELETYPSCFAMLSDIRDAYNWREGSEHVTQAIC